MICACGETGWVLVGKDELLVAVVDAADDAVVSSVRWIKNSRYAGDSQGGLMHRMVLGLAPGDKRCVDHINRNGMDNRRCNLRVVEHAFNMRNRKKHAHSGQPYKGVEYDRSAGSYRARIRVGGIRYGGKSTKCAETAAREYDELARRFHGEYAATNESLGLLTK